MKHILIVANHANSFPAIKLSCILFGIAAILLAIAFLSKAGFPHKFTGKH
jgi:hypothetical protein